MSHHVTETAEAVRKLRFQMRKERDLTVRVTWLEKKMTKFITGGWPPIWPFGSEIIGRLVENKIINHLKEIMKVIVKLPE